uniref:Uncharacterized protein n=1 Tax=Anguilla anguilla TaxID=7936 RepID=A0A0E9QGG0_ANGAN
MFSKIGTFSVCQSHSTLDTVVSYLGPLILVFIYLFCSRK